MGLVDSVGSELSILGLSLKETTPARQLVRCSSSLDLRRGFLCVEDRVDRVLDAGLAAWWAAWFWLGSRRFRV